MTLLEHQVPRKLRRKVRFEFFETREISEAISLLKSYGRKAKIIAGGTDILVELKDSILDENPELLVSISSIPGLDLIEDTETGLRIGSLVTLHEIERDRLIRERYTVLAEAAHSVGILQRRNVGTVGGNLCQGAKCWYYRATGNAYFCFRKGGDVCYARMGNNRFHSIIGYEHCVCSSSSDLAPALISLKARVKIAGSSQENIVPLENFYTPNGNVLKPDEILTEIQIPRPRLHTYSTYLKFRLRKAIDPPLASVAASATFEDAICIDARIVLGGVAPYPWRARRIEQMLRGTALEEQTAENCSKIVSTSAAPLSKNAYKVEISKTLVKRAIRQIRRKAGLGNKVYTRATQ